MWFNKWFTSIKIIMGEKITIEEMVERIKRVLSDEEYYIFMNDMQDKFLAAYNYTLDAKAGDIYWNADHNLDFNSTVKAEKYCQKLILAEQKKMEEMYSELKVKFFDEMIRKLITLLGKKEFSQCKSITLEQFYDIINRVEWIDLNETEPNQDTNTTGEGLLNAIA